MEIYTILFNHLLSETAKRQASDLHLSAGSLPVLRQDGRLVTLDGEKLITQETLAQIVRSFLTESEGQTLDDRRELTVVKILGGHFRFKINIYYQKGLLAASFRLLAEAVRDFNALHLPPAVAELPSLANGLVIVAGVYGSGKTTTLGAIIEQVNQRQKKRILTLENTIEIVFTNQQSIVEQREIGKDVPSLAAGLRYCQNEDIDIVMVADTRDESAEAMSLILELAASNSLVLLEMHADSAQRALEKILDAFPQSPAVCGARTLLADVLEAVVVQRLLPKNGGGQVMAWEILLGTPAIRSVLRTGKLEQLESVIQTSGGEGMVSMTTSLVRLVQGGQISQADALAAASNKEDFQIMSK